MGSVEGTGRPGRKPDPGDPAAVAEAAETRRVLREILADPVV